MQSIVIKGILEDELDRSYRMLRTYEEKMLTLPKGSIFIRKRGEREYCYLNYRENNKVISKYIGSHDSEAVDILKRNIQERKRISGLIKNIKIEIAEIRKALY